VTPLAPGKIAPIAAVAAVVIVIAVWFRNPGGWIDALLLLAVAGALGLLVLVMAG
jgi:hypothetical protein